MHNFSKIKVNNYIENGIDFPNKFVEIEPGLDENRDFNTPVFKSN
jgi:hypothetical protein